MRTFVSLAALIAVCMLPHTVWSDQPAVTVYNQNFGVVREKIALTVEPGLNQLQFTDVTAHLEPDSVVLRDPQGRHHLQILEQNYRADPVSQGLLLSLFEGQTIDFLVPGKELPVSGKIIRSGYVQHHQHWQQYAQPYYVTQALQTAGATDQPIIELDGKLRFGLPGTPLFPNLSSDTILKPTLHWLLETDAAGALEAELSYITGGMSWKADYNVVAPEEGDVLDLVGWVTVDNRSGRTFDQARVKLMAGDVSKIQPAWATAYPMSRAELSADFAGGLGPPVTEKTFDEYHLYTLRRATTLRDRETKQVEFVRASGVQSRRVYVYDGLKLNRRRYQGWGIESLRIQSEYGTQCNPKVWVMREFENVEENQLGLPLPAGRVRFYRQDDDGQLEFVGENEIDHTPRDETVRIYTGNAFDLTGERRRTHFQVDNAARWVDESVEIKVRNHKDGPVEVRVVEHLYRWYTWEMKQTSHDYVQTDAQTVEFRIVVPPDGEIAVSYAVHYTW